MADEVRRYATISDDGLYRYSLGRYWAWPASNRIAVFVGLNPSTADGETDDATIRVCMGYARRWGYGGLLMLNLFALRATDPRELADAQAHGVDPVGPKNHDYLDSAHPLRTHSFTVACWGAHPMTKTLEAKRSIARLGIVYALATTKDGSPCHPLRQRTGITPRLWTPPQ